MHSVVELNFSQISLIELNKLVDHLLSTLLKVSCLLVYHLTDCSYEDIANTGSLACSAYNNHYQQLQGEVWVVVLASLVMGGMGLAIGGNDVANAWCVAECVLLNEIITSELFQTSYD